MIRINLLGQVRPKATKSAVPVEGMLQLVMPLIALGAALVVLGIIYYQQKTSLDATNNKIQQLRVEKASLEQVKQDVDRFETEKATLQQRIDVIENLQKNRSGGQEFLQMVANTVGHVDELWLTSVNRTGSNFDVQGEAGSIDAVANFITQMKRSGYFDNVEIKEAKENDVKTGVETYAFTMSATINPTGGAAIAAAQTQATSAAQPPAQPNKGRI